MTLAIDCFDPPTVQAAETIMSTRSFGSQVTYQCSDGTWMKRNVFNQTITCDSNGHWKPKDTITECISKNNRHKILHIGRRFLYLNSYKAHYTAQTIKMHVRFQRESHEKKDTP